ncbi:MAG TPA: DEAD/DEAH box helicase [Limnochordales bacterium]
MAVRYRLVPVLQEGGPRVVVRPVPDEVHRCGLPLFAAHEAARQLARYRCVGGLFRGGLAGWVARARTRWLTRRLLRGLGYGRGDLYVDWPEGAGGGPAASPRQQADQWAEASVEAVVDQVAEALTGRLYLEDELVQWARRHGLSAQAVVMAAEALVAEGKACRWPAVELQGGRPLCRRCGARQAVVREACVRCGCRACPRCLTCAAMGFATGCQALYAMPAGRAREPSFQPPNAPYSLGRAQQSLAARLVQLVDRHLQEIPPGSGRDGRPGEDPFANLPHGCLVWAVTGAGKTEVALQAVARALQLGWPVAFAVPRRDVAQEVARRARQWLGDGVELRMGRAAPQGRPVPGVAAPAEEGSPEAARTQGTGVEPGRLVVATTHQLLRFYRAFGLVVLDEADAYPFRDNPVLEQAALRALQPGGLLVVMTATPGRLWLARARRAGWPVLVLPARFHGHPLPVPEVWVHREMAAWQREPDRPDRVPARIREWLQARDPGRRLLVFAPTVGLAEAVGRALRVPVCHSRHPDRARTVQAFLQGRMPVLVSSPLLERGLTFPGVDVLVVFADWEGIFDEAALVQMAGRCGRSPQDPAGRVLLAASRFSHAMRAACRHLASMNRQAQQLGFLRDASRGQGAEVV